MGKVTNIAAFEQNWDLLYVTFIKLLRRFINVLTAILSLEVLQVLLSSSYNFESK